MYQTMSLPLYSWSFEEYHGWGDLRAELAALGCDGMEGIWSRWKSSRFSAEVPVIPSSAYTSTNSHSGLPVMSSV